MVEDEAVSRELFVQALTKAGWTVDEAEDGREALARLDVNKPDVILLDLLMPVMDGFAFLEKLRRRPDGSTVPVVVATAKELHGKDRVRLDGQVQKILLKGDYDPMELMEEVRRLLQRFSTGRSG